MPTIRNETPADVAARNAVLDIAYGRARFRKPSERLRKGRAPAAGLALVATADDGSVVGTVRVWTVEAGAGRPALLLGPLAVHPAWQGRGIGGALMARAIRNARLTGHRAILLVGDAPYYGRFGFSAEKTGGLWLDGLADRSRLLGHELVAGALDGAHGAIHPPAAHTEVGAKRRARLMDAVAGLMQPAAPQAA